MMTELRWIKRDYSKCDEWEFQVWQVLSHLNHIIFPSQIQQILSRRIGRISSWFFLDTILKQEPNQETALVTYSIGLFLNYSRIMLPFYRSIWEEKNLTFRKNIGMCWSHIRKTPMVLEFKVNSERIQDRGYETCKTHVYTVRVSQECSILKRHNNDDYQNHQ